MRGFQAWAAKIIKVLKCSVLRNWRNDGRLAAGLYLERRQTAIHMQYLTGNPRTGWIE